MNVFFIVDEFPFFLPSYLLRTIRELDSLGFRVVGITPLVTPRGHKTLYSYLMKELPKLGIVSVFKLGFSYAGLILGRIGYTLGVLKVPYTVSQVAHMLRIPVVMTSRVNDPRYLNELRQLDIDIIVSSCSQIFKNDILSLPRLACINRHSGLLPSYGGLFPVFQAMIRDEKYVGATVHKMVARIDGGVILAQEKCRVQQGDTLFSLYEKTYALSVPVTVQAICKLRDGKKTGIKNTYPESYYSFPAGSDWDMFWSKRKKVI